MYDGLTIELLAWFQNVWLKEKFLKFSLFVYFAIFSIVPRFHIPSTDVKLKVKIMRLNHFQAISMAKRNLPPYHEMSFYRYQYPFLFRLRYHAVQENSIWRTYVVIDGKTLNLESRVIWKTFFSGTPRTPCTGPCPFVIPTWPLQHATWPLRHATWPPVSWWSRRPRSSAMEWPRQRLRHLCTVRRSRQAKSSMLSSIRTNRLRNQGRRHSISRSAWWGKLFGWFLLISEGDMIKI